MSRNIDIYSLESRVNTLETDIEPKPIRSYDLYSLEKRVYNLEQGGSPTPPEPTPTGAELLWSRSASGTGAFNVSLDLTNYESFIIEGVNGVGGEVMHTYCPQKGTFYLGSHKIGSEYPVYRQCTISNTGVNFGNGFEGYGSPNGTVAIPLKIYGLKSNILPS